MKVVTILAGAVHVSLFVFMDSCVRARGARFLALAWALSTYGEAIRHFLERYLRLVAGIAAILFMVAYFGLKQLFRNGGFACRGHPIEMAGSDTCSPTGLPTCCYRSAPLFL